MSGLLDWFDRLRSPEIYLAPDSDDDGLAGDLDAVRIVLSDVPEVSPQAMEAFWASLFRGPLFFVIAGYNEGGVPRCSFLAAGESGVLEQVVQSLRSISGVQVQPAKDEIARIRERFRSGLVSASLEVQTGRPPCFPIRTWKIASGAQSEQTVRFQTDPLAMLAGIRTEPGEQVVYQVSVLGRVPPGWASGYRWMTKSDVRLQMASPAWQQRSAALTGMIVLGLVDLALLCWSLALFSRSLVLGALGMLPVVGFLPVSWWLGKRLYGKFTEAGELIMASPELVASKINSPALRVGIACFASANRRDRVEHLLSQMRSALSMYDLEGGNFLRVWQRAGRGPFSVPSVFSLFSPEEMAGLYHPVIDPVRLPVVVPRTTMRPRGPAPLPAGGGEILLGLSVADGQEVRLSLSALNRGMLVVGKPRQGKSTLLQQIALAAISHGQGLILVDPHRDTLQVLLEHMPRERVGDVFVLDIADQERSFGLNPLDMTLGVSVDEAVEILVQVLRQYWQDYWGPRMENALRQAAKTIALVNWRRAREDPSRQLGLLFVGKLLEAGASVRATWLAENLPFGSQGSIAAGVKEVMEWWNYFDSWAPSFRQEVISPVQSKLYRVRSSTALGRVLGAPQTTVPIFQIVSEGKILLCNTGAMQIGTDLGALVGSVVMGLVMVGFQRQSYVPASQRRPSVVIVDEFQAMAPVVPWGDLLGQMPKFGSSAVLATQTLASLRTDREDLTGRVLGGVQGLVVFGVSYEDAEILARELGGNLPPEALRDLPDYTAYVRGLDRLRDGAPMERIPAQLIRTVGLGPGDPSVSEEIIRRRAAYTLPHPEAERLWLRQMEELQWGGKAVALAMVSSVVSGSAQRSGGEMDRDAVLRASRVLQTVSVTGFSNKSGAVGRGLKAVSGGQ